MLPEWHDWDSHSFIKIGHHYCLINVHPRKPTGDSPAPKWDRFKRFSVLNFIDWLNLKIFSMRTLPWTAAGIVLLK